MKRQFAVMILVFSLTLLIVGAAEESTTAPPLANEVWKAHGGENWAKVKEVRFNFVVEQEGKQLFSAQHVWNVPAGTDHVKWKDKQGTDHDVTVNVVKPPEDEAGKAAYARWVNDSYWLIAPLKLRDPGVKVQADGSKDLNGTAAETLRVSFEQVGLTPTDQYVLYVDPQTKLLRAWDYVPNPGPGMQATWEKYQQLGGLNLATEHNFNGKTVRFTDLQVAADK
jgi:plastocyanin